LARELKGSVCYHTPKTSKPQNIVLTSGTPRNKFGQYTYAGCGLTGYSRVK